MSNFTTPRPSTSREPQINLPGYTICERLGSGSYASVYRALSTAPGASGVRETVAIKCIEKKRLRNSAAVDNMIAEISILKNLRHRHIVQLIDFRWDATYIYLIMEYCNGGDLSKFIRTHRQLPERVARKFARQLASAMHYLHSQNVAHMDLKPHNLMIVNYNRMPVLKMADFGFAQHLQYNFGEEQSPNNSPPSTNIPPNFKDVKPTDTSRWKATMFRGSLLYMAPEIFKRLPYDSGVDLWSIGVILYECVYGVAPFSCNSEETLIAHITSNTPIVLPVCQPPLSANCTELINGLLQRDPTHRLTFDQFFHHPFIDIAHAPDAQSIVKGDTISQQARRSAADKNWASAVKLYCQSLDHYLAALQYIDDIHARDGLREKIRILLGDAERCKRAARPDDFVAPETARTSGNVEERTKQMWADTPQVAASLTIGKRAEQLDCDEKWTEALQKYSLAVETLLAILAANSKMQDSQERLPLIRRYANKWLTRAEMLRTYCDLDECHLSEVPGREIEVLQVEEDAKKMATSENGSPQQCKMM